jgi:hypothetical protein
MIYFKEGMSLRVGLICDSRNFQYFLLFQIYSVTMGVLIV